MEELLIIEPDGNMQQTLQSALGEDYRIRFARSADEAIELLDVRTADAVILELSLPGHSGLEFMYEFRSYVDWRDVPVIVYSSQQVTQKHIDSIGWKELGIAKYLYKPQTSIADLQESIRQTTAKDTE